MKTWMVSEALFPGFLQRYEDISARADLQTVRAERTEDHASASNAAPAVVNGVAQIPVKGVLVAEYDWILDFMTDGNFTSYDSLLSQVAAAEADPRVKSIEYLFDSPGGDVSGLFDTFDLLRGVKKPSVAKAKQAASAAYLLANAAGSIQATSAASVFGSVGVLTTRQISENTVQITSSEAPDKAPDPKTESGQNKIREYLDQLHGMLVSGIATGRSSATGTPVSVSAVNETFGRGGVFLARESLSRKMIDSIFEAGAASTQPAGAKDIMDATKLKAEFPEVYEAVFALGRSAGVQEGSTQALDKERARVSAHLKMGEAYKAPEVAIKAISAGAELDQTMIAEYLTKLAIHTNAVNTQADVAEAGQAVAAVKAAEVTQSAALDEGDKLVLSMGLITQEELLARKKGAA